MSYQNSVRIHFAQGRLLVTLSPRQLVRTANESLLGEFFQASVGKWRSERRYYTLPEGETKEMISIITIRYLEQGCDELQKLAQMHNLSDTMSLVCGAEVIWESTDSISGRKESKGKTLFGAKGNTLYRDRGFATTKPVTAQYFFPNPTTLCLRTEYNGSVFEEELKLVGSKYRTRQSIISRAGEQLMIGQYLEKRI
ncbi:phycobiliprotein lyase [Chlorogloeopsis fritschii PCC 9212]|uniref:Chromophore lyase CpcS/CpeS n=1 Tax=Chlorogloeopsis fritschii PCC 6912 TaxID=211165 RepID=A0A3S1FS23_CHLFR|nr:phycobiliprotein lyase [Chlorogloeopsis fritschii]RUR84521.1 chromophore lyase CpcS/CpeS [Chlorogloeopsis fritschii PCC 6912]